MTKQFILASHSPQRKKILKMLDIPFEVISSHIDETVESVTKPEKLVCSLALRKAQQVSSRFRDRIVIGADTVVVLKGDVLGKPSTLSEAKSMLHKLSGNTHSVYSGVAMMKCNKQSSLTFFERTDVTFYGLSSQMINYYVQTYRPLDKAGAYGIQDWSACFVKSISGCYHNVVGFPVSKFVSYLRNPDTEKLLGPYNWFGKEKDTP